MGQQEQDTMLEKIFSLEDPDMNVAHTRWQHHQPDTHGSSAARGYEDDFVIDAAERIEQVEMIELIEEIADEDEADNIILENKNLSGLSQMTQMMQMA